MTALVEHVSFLDDLEVRYEDGRTWTIVKEFDFASCVLERIVRVPAGTSTDFASFPQLLWWIWPPTGRYGKGAVIHDAIYRGLRTFAPPLPMTRRLADATLFEALVALRVNGFTCWAMWLAVRLFGRPHYRSEAA